MSRSTLTTDRAVLERIQNVLAFEPTLNYEIRRVDGAGMLSAAGLYNCVFSGQGRIAITAKGSPVVLNVDQPTYADPQAVIAWSASLQTGFHRADQLGLGTLLGRTTGEAFTMSFAGQGFVIVQPRIQRAQRGYEVSDSPAEPAECAGARSMRPYTAAAIR